ncbi:ATP-binding cassette domain-containing protein [Saccharibacillus sp. O23]|uniref:ATP-binding cassette domain-containing protein n=1 Tax=Saccharibacillus sp. O23 TaxID=2009338 RepID=UPI0015C60E7E|nr:ATP-binding cassette domain-containing protein [Saccharibacillus sp. O23]
MKLKVCEVSKRYDSKVLDGISFEVDQGIVGLLGENGAGKTTLMEIIATLARPDTGKVEYDGKERDEDLYAIRRRIGYLPQKFDFFAKISVEEALDYFCRLKHISSPEERKREIEEKLVQVGLIEHRKKQFGALSGGMKQRVGIAQAMIGDPALLLVDEPTVGLDPHERAAFRQLLSELAADRVVLLSTHIVEDIAMTSERLLVLHEGRVNYYGDLSTFIRSVEGKVWMYRGPSVPESLRRRPSLILSSQATAEGVEVRYIAETPIERSVPVEPTLEHAYMYANRKRTDYE